MLLTLANGEFSITTIALSSSSPVSTRLSTPMARPRTTEPRGTEGPSTSTSTLSPSPPLDFSNTERGIAP
jgi:hypothetical protein